MLYHILYALRDEFGALNVFRYLTFRSMVAFFLALTFVVVFQPRFINWFRKRSLAQPIRDDGPQSHQSKKGTPTMGGVVVVVAILLTTLLLADLRNLYVWITVFVTTVYAGLGFYDDYEKVIKKSSKGISARKKLAWQFGAATFAVILLGLFSPEYSTKMHIPFFKDYIVDLGYLYPILAVLVIVGSSNAVNLTDGLDGLVTGPIMTVAFAFGVFAYVASHKAIADYLGIPHVPGAGDLAIIAAAIIAGGLGFLWYNAFPAQVFMGDVGALALGGTLGTLAIITKQELALVIAGGVFVLEALSVIMQVAYFKLTGRRVFRMAPLHHHFELGGIAEPKIIVRCWIISIVLAVVAMTTLKLR
jgi:phospho-N-acetylmuramoyl-pentapeptide-transferase